MIKSRVLSLVIVLACFLHSCGSDNNDPDNSVTISVANFTTTIDENPTSGFSLGTVEASTTQGTIVFSLSQQSPNQALEINASTGELSVLTASLFDFETNPTITALVTVSSSGATDTATLPSI